MWKKSPSFTNNSFQVWFLNFYHVFLDLSTNLFQDMTFWKYRYWVVILGVEIKELHHMLIL